MRLIFFLLSGEFRFCSRRHQASVFVVRKSWGPSSQLQVLILADSESDSSNHQPRSNLPTAGCDAKLLPPDPTSPLVAGRTDPTLHSLVGTHY